ncbi:MAG: hypothetical protein IKQ35_01100 [Bacilli bacterium]|nr:hypothetical protein [Bacilli bacterium]
MLDKYKDYENFYKIMKNCINDHKISHAYMFEVDESIDIEEFKYDIVKIIITKDGSENLDLLELIDSNNYPNIRFISPDGQFIKKNQIEELQNDFSKESFDNKTKIYVVLGADKLNKVSANKILKFLEEPSSDIIALFITNNKYAVIDTIKSRCINISLKKQEKKVLNEDSFEYKIINIIETKKNKSLYLLYELLNNDEITRDDIRNIFINISQIYLDLINITNNIETFFYDLSCLNQIRYDNNKELLVKKVDVINKYIDYLSVNINIKTFIDEVIYGIYGGE